MVPLLPTDPTRIDKNPFANDVHHPQRELERLAEFFDGIPKDAHDLGTGWNRFQNRHGAATAIQLSLAIDTLKNLRAIHDRLRSTGDDGVGGLIIVFHIALLELVERGQKQSGDGATKAVIRALQRGLPVEEKKRLILGFSFSDPYPAREGEERLGRLHVHCRELKRAGKATDPGCLTCPPPADAELDRFVASLAQHLYAMRSAFFHRATWVWFAGLAMEMEGVPTTDGEMLDGYYDRENRIIVYRTTFLLEQLVPILRRCAWNRLAQ
jgi:hypothetical protein